MATLIIFHGKGKGLKKDRIDVHAILLNRDHTSHRQFRDNPRVWNIIEESRPENELTIKYETEVLLYEVLGNAITVASVSSLNK